MFSSRHSSSPRERTGGKQQHFEWHVREEKKNHHHHHHAGAKLSEDDASALAEKINDVSFSKLPLSKCRWESECADWQSGLTLVKLQVGCNYITEKMSAHAGSVHETSAVQVTKEDAQAVANKVIKEGAREMERMEGKSHGHIYSGSDAALAQSVKQWKDDPSAPEHKVAEKIRDKMIHAQETYGHSEFQGPNPDAGKDANRAWHHVTASTHQDRNPDVLD